MIYDHLDRIGQYRGLGRNFGPAIDWLTNTDLQALTFHPPADAGLHKPKIAGEDGIDVYAMLMTYQPNPVEKTVWESHRQYADIQVVVSGIEQMGIAMLHDGVPVTRPYTAESDAALYGLPRWDEAKAMETSNASVLPYGPGMFGIFLPQDIHAPMLAIPGKVGTVRKIVVKVRLDQPA